MARLSRTVPLRFVFKCRKDRITIGITFTFQQECFAISQLVLNSRDHGNSLYHAGGAPEYWGITDPEDNLHFDILDDMARHTTEFVMLAHSPANQLAQCALPSAQPNQPPNNAPPTFYLIRGFNANGVCLRNRLRIGLAKLPPGSQVPGSPSQEGAHEPHEANAH